MLTAPKLIFNSIFQVGRNENKTLSKIEDMSKTIIPDIVDALCAVKVTAVAEPSRAAAVHQTPPGNTFFATRFSARIS